jgi:hypothetical protein
MGSIGPGPLKEERRFFSRFRVAHGQRRLYDFDRASRRDPKQEAIAVTRAIVVVALIGGAIWFLLWKVLSHIMANH